MAKGGLISIELKPSLDKIQKKFAAMQKRAINSKVGFDVIGAKGFKDVIDHFEKEQGSKRKWVKWNRKTSDGRRRFFSSRPYGKGGNKLLQDTGRLRASISFKGMRNSAKVFTKTGYGKFHQFGTNKMVKRDFLWIAPKVRRDMAIVYVRFIARGR